MYLKIKSLIVIAIFSVVFSACQANEQQSNLSNSPSPTIVSTNSSPNSLVADNGNLAKVNNAETKTNQAIKINSNTLATPKPSILPTTAPTVSGTPKFKNYTATGIIKKIDVENNSVTIDHGDIGDYMVGMEMPFPVISKNTLSNLKIGDKVEFVLETGVGVERIVSIKKK